MQIIISLFVHSNVHMGQDVLLNILNLFWSLKVTYTFSEMSILYVRHMLYNIIKIKTIDF